MVSFDECDIRKDDEGLWVCPYCLDSLTSITEEVETIVMQYRAFEINYETGKLEEDLEQYQQSEIDVNAMLDGCWVCDNCGNNIYRNCQTPLEMNERIEENYQTITRRAVDGI